IPRKHDEQSLEKDKNSMKSRISLQLGVALAFALMFSTSRASADFQLTTSNDQNTGAGPFINVHVALTGQTATFTFTSLTNGGNIFLMGAQGAVAVNLNTTSWTVGTMTGTNSGTGFSPGPLSNGGAGNEDGFGSFNQTINSFDSFTHSSDTVTF